MPLIFFDCKGIPATRRERIEGAAEAGGSHVKEQYEGWIAADPFRGGVWVVITGPQGFERTVLFALDEDPAVIDRRVTASAAPFVTPRLTSARDLMARFGPTSVSSTDDDARCIAAPTKDVALDP